MRTITTFCLLLLCVTAFSQVAKKKKLAFIPYAGNKTSVEKLRDFTYQGIFEMANRIFVNTQRFEIIDRKYFDVRLLEMNVTKGEAFINSQIVKQGRSKAAEVIAVAYVSEISTPRSEDKLAFSAYVTVEFKEIDVETGQTVGAYQLKGECIDPKIGTIKVPIQLRATTAERAIGKALSAMEKDLEKWITDNFPITMKILELREEDKERLLVADGGKDIGLKLTHRMRVVLIRKIQGKKDVTTLAKLKLHDRLEDQITKFKMLNSNKDDWAKIKEYYQKDSTSVIITEDPKSN